MADRCRTAGPVRGRWLLIGLNALVGSAVTLAIPTILGRSVDSIAGGTGYGRWLIAVGFLVVLGIAASTVDALLGSVCVTAIGPVAVAAIAPPVGSLVLLAMIDPRLAAALIGGVLLSEALTIAGTTERGPGLHNHGVVTWRVLAPVGAPAAIVGPIVLVATVAGLQFVEGDITAGELLAAGPYAFLGAGMCNLTAVLGEVAAVKTSCRTAAPMLRSTGERSR